MITPAYNLTSTERVLPRMALDFTTGALDSRVTVTRSLNTATRINSSGLIELVNANLPRFDFSPTSIGVCRGLLIEEARINLTQYSQDFTNAWWSKTNLSFGTSGTAPDGTNTANFILPNTVNDYHYITRAISSTATNTVSWFIKPTGIYTKVSWFEEVNTGNYAVFDLTGPGSVIQTSGSTATIALTSNGFYRITATASSFGLTGFSLWFVPQTYTSGIPVIGWQPNGTDGFLVWGAQFEAGAFATSYIPTTTTSLTRNADQAAMTGTNFSSWYNATEGTFYSEFTPIATTAAGGGTILMATDGTKNGYGFYKGSVSNSLSTLVVSNATVIGSVTVGDVQKAILGYNSTNIRSILNRNGLFTTATASVGSLASLYLGRSWYAGDFMSGHIRKTSYWPQKLTDAELTANTY